ncbi:MAG: head-tail connector protein, partial [Acetobacteraceae bacterium]|nr:head-tail connector protein [Acetobacteraceae bacterium]
MTRHPSPRGRPAAEARTVATAAALLARCTAARERRRPIEPIWQACYDHALPAPGGDAALFDATAADAAEQLAASLLAELTPPWSRWFGLAPSRALDDSPAGRAATESLEDAAATLQAHFDRSNFAIEMHQAFLDLVVAGTAVLLVEEAPLGEASAFRFAALPAQTAILEEGPDGRLTTLFREARLTPAAIAARYPGAALPAMSDAEARLRVVEATWADGPAIRHAALLAEDPDRPVTLAEGRFAEHPVIAFRWLKAPGESYGRGPVMKALPDIRTANKVVELVLK